MRANLAGHVGMSHPVRVDAVPPRGFQFGAAFDGVPKMAECLIGDVERPSTARASSATTDVTFAEDVGARFEAYGWHVQRIDGQDPTAVDAAIGIPGCPEFAFCTASIDSVRIVLMHSSSRPSDARPGSCFSSSDLLIVMSLFHRACERGAEHVQSSRDIRTEMHAERATFTLDQDREVSTRLRRLDHTERILLTRDRDVHGIGTGDLEKDTAGRTGFVDLARGMQETRAES
jgi:hypothetical protein